jgi:hypothetical protein
MEAILLVYWCGMGVMVLGAAVMAWVVVVDCFE